MTKSAFRAAAIKWLAWLFGAALSIHVLALSLGAMGMCKGSSSPCLGFMFVFFFVARPIALIAFALLLAWVTHRRVAALGLSIGWSIAAAIWMFGALPLLAFGVSAWNTSFLVGLLTTSRLDLLALALSFIAFLSYAEPSAIHNDRSDMRLAWVFAIASAAHFTLLHLPTIFWSISLVPVLGIWLLSVLRPLITALQYAASLGVPGRHLYWLQWLDFAIFSAALAYLIITQSDDGESRGDVAAAPRFAPRPATPRASFGKLAR